MKKSIVTMIAFGLLLVMCLSACAQTQFPNGTFVYVSRGDYKLDYVLELHDDGTWVHYINQEIGSFGTYSIKGNEFVFVTDDYCDADQTGPANYIWTFEDGILSFTVKGSDPCVGRSMFINNTRYKKQP